MSVALSEPKPPAPGAAAALFVWSVWAILFAFALLFVCVYGSNVPHWDDVNVVPWLAGERGVSWEWLWATHNEHRIVVPKLLLLSLAWLSGCDLRAGMLFNVVALAAAAATLILAVRSRRGFTTAADAVFPLALLHVGQQQNLLWGFQVGFVAGAVLVTLLLAAVVRGRGLTLAAIGVMLLPLCGANTLAFAPGMVLWLAVVGLMQWQSDGLAKAAPALLGAGLTVVLMALYFLGWEGPRREVAANDTLAGLRIAAQFLSTAPGPAVRHVWPLSALVLIALSIGTAVLLGMAAWRGIDRERTLGLLALLTGFALLAAGVGWGRGQVSAEAGLVNRYVTLTAPLVCLLCCAWELYLPPQWRRMAPALVFTVFALLLVPNTMHGLARGRERRDWSLAVEHAARSGASPRELIRDFGRVICPPAAEAEALEALEVLRRHGRGPYSRTANK